MKDELERKLQSIKKIEPSETNESIIRNLCHSLMCEIENDNTENKFYHRLEKECYMVLNRLEREKILSLGSEKFMPFYKYDLPLLVKNAVCASEIFLSSPKHTFSDYYSSPAYAVCSERLITRAVCEEIMYFYTKYRYAAVTFSVTKKLSCFLLSVKADVNNQNSEYNSEKFFSVMRKTAFIHKGAFLARGYGGKEEHYLSIGNSFDKEAKYKRIPSYIDMLSDKTSSIYVILSSAF